MHKASEKIAKPTSRSNNLFTIRSFNSFNAGARIEILVLMSVNRLRLPSSQSRCSSDWVSGINSSLPGFEVIRTGISKTRERILSVDFTIDRAASLSGTSIPSLLGDPPMLRSDFRIERLAGSTDIVKDASATWASSEVVITNSPPWTDNRISGDRFSIFWSNWTE